MLTKYLFHFSEAQEINEEIVCSWSETILLCLQFGSLQRHPYLISSVRSIYVYLINYVLPILYRHVLDIHTHDKSEHQNVTAAMFGVFAGGNKSVILLLCWWMIGIKSRFKKSGWIRFLIESGFCQKLFARHLISYKKSNL